MEHEWGQISVSLPPGWRERVKTYPDIRSENNPSDTQMTRVMFFFFLIIKRVERTEKIEVQESDCIARRHMREDGWVQKIIPRFSWRLGQSKVTSMWSSKGIGPLKNLYQDLTHITSWTVGGDIRPRFQVKTDRPCEKTHSDGALVVVSTALVR